VKHAERRLEVFEEQYDKLKDKIDVDPEWLSILSDRIAELRDYIDNCYIERYSRLPTDTKGMRIKELEERLKGLNEIIDVYKKEGDTSSRTVRINKERARNYNNLIHKKKKALKELKDTEMHRDVMVGYYPANKIQSELKEYDSKIAKLKKIIGNG
jgi:lysozyme family protein